MTQPSVVGLFVYPIKSCGGVSLSRATLVTCGMRFDRRYMVVDEEGRFITARTVPKLLAVEVSLSPESTFAISATHPTMGDPLRLSEIGPDQGANMEIRVWRDTAMARLNEEGSAWFSRLLGRTVHLVYLPTEHLRQIDPDRSRQGEVVSFADGYPLLLTNRHSLDEVNDQMNDPVAMDRFRPNVVVAGLDAFSEDTWEELTIGPARFFAPKLCDRCVMTTIDPRTGTKGVEPMRTLARTRKWGGAVWFGTNLIHRNLDELGADRLELGDPVCIEKTRPHPRDLPRTAGK